MASARGLAGLGREDQHVTAPAATKNRPRKHWVQVEVAGLCHG